MTDLTAQDQILLSRREWMSNIGVILLPAYCMQEVLVDQLKDTLQPFSDI